MMIRISLAAAWLLAILMCTTAALAQNHAPVATNDTVTTLQGRVVFIDVLANDSDRDGNLLTVSVVSNSLPSPSALTNHGDGSFSYTVFSQHPVGAFNFTYNLSDGRGSHRQATVTITVDADVSPQPPVAVDDSLTTHEGEQIVGLFAQLVANDLPDPGSVSVDSFTPPEHGSIDPLNGGSYTPPASSVETDSFTYRVTDGSGVVSDPATVRITIEPATVPNIAPVAFDDPQFTTEQGSTLSILYSELLANDSDPDDGPEPLDFCWFSSEGTLGSLRLTIPSVVYTAPASLVGTDTFQYKACDGLAESNPATVTITVTRRNLPPVAVNDAFTADQDTPLQLAPSQLLANDYDPDGDAFYFDNNSEPSHGQLGICWPGCIYTPSAGYFGTDSFTYTLRDSFSAVSAPATVTITVRATLVPSFAVSCDGLDCTFDASGSVAPADATYTWSFGDETSGTGSVVSHRYSRGGSFTVTLSLSHATGSQAATSITVDVIDLMTLLLVILD